MNDNANSCNSPLNIAREEIPDLYSVKVHDHFPKLVGVHMNEQREQQQRSPMSHCPMLYYHYLFSCFRFHSISLTAISISSSWPNKIRSRSRHQVQIGDDLAMDEANSILMRANDQVTIMIWSSCRLWRWFWKAIWMQLVLVRTKWWQSPGGHFLDFSIFPIIKVSYVCDVIANDPRLADGYNGIGISQVKTFQHWLVPFREILSSNSNPCPTHDPRMVF